MKITQVDAIKLASEVTGRDSLVGDLTYEQLTELVNRAFEQGVQSTQVNENSMAKPVAWRVWGIDSKGKHFVRGIYGEKAQAEATEAWLGEFWAGTDELFEGIGIGVSTSANKATTEEKPHYKIVAWRYDQEGVDASEKVLPIITLNQWDVELEDWTETPLWEEI